MIEPTSHRVACPDVDLHYLRWGEPASGRPSAILMHGLKFVGATWSRLATILSREYTVYAVDRRGHGRSTVRAPAKYEFNEYCRDLVALLDALDIRNAYGVGHSAGGTDLLLSAGMRPHAFARILVMEPTVQDPKGERDADPALSGLCTMLLARTRSRQASFPDRQSAYEHMSTRSPLKGWNPELLRAYVEHAFKDAPNGGVTLSCPPDTEAEMLVPIFLTMENRYPGGEFALLAEVPCPALILSADRSDPIYAAMASIAAAVVPRARHERVRDATHFWPQENPEEFAAQVAAFANE